MKILAAIASILIIIGALNWGLYGIGKIDIVDSLFGGWNNKIGRAIYMLIGIAGLYSLLYVIFAWNKKTCLMVGMFFSLKKFVIRNLV